MGLMGVGRTVSSAIHVRWSAIPGIRIPIRPRLSPLRLCRLAITDTGS